MLALFPALIAIFSLLGVIGQGQAASDAILGIVDDVAPGGTADVVRGPIEQFASSPAAGFALVSGLVVAIWSASGYVTAFSRAMNRIYEIEEGRPFWKLKPVQLIVTVISLVLIVVAAVILVVSGPVADAVGSALGIGETATVVWSIAKWPALALVLVLILAILYYATPNAKQPTFRWMSIGAFVALIGAEFDAELERGRQLQAGIAAEEDIRSPPRDTRKSDKAAAKEQQDVEEGRRIREQHGD